MTYDPNVPLLLKKEQQWFGSILNSPIDENNHLSPHSPSGVPIEIEASEHIVPSHSLKPHQRIQIYAQQYWWRMLDTLQEDFPFVTRLFGYQRFNRLVAIPYLVKYSSRNWSMNLIGDRLSQWIEEEYCGNDKELVLKAVKLDWAFSQSFLAEELPPLMQEHLPSEESLEEIFEQKLYLQPHINLFEMECDLFQFRVELLKHLPDYWLNHAMPTLESSHKRFFVLYRNKRNDLSWKEISRGEYHLLHFFQSGSSIDKVCEWLETQEADLYQNAMENLSSWFQEWTSRGWLSLKASG